jgi:SAM-dependent methyltransferase
MDNPLYYEQDSIWGDLQKNPFFREKVRIMIAMIPEEVKSIVDLGCGDGEITNILAQKYDVIGVDRSKEALKHVKCKTILSSCEKIDINNNSFDLVFSSELLEHLPDEIFNKTINEMMRITRRYILISVPYKENLRFRFIRCEKCKYTFHIYGHLQTFSIKKLQNYFYNCKLRSYAFCGDYEPIYNKFLLLIKQYIGKSWFWCEDAHPLCPSCNNTKFKHSISWISRACDYLNYRVLKKEKNKNYWIILLFEKKGDNR